MNEKEGVVIRLTTYVYYKVQKELGPTNLGLMLEYDDDDEVVDCCFVLNGEVLAGPHDIRASHLEKLPREAYHTGMDREFDLMEKWAAQLIARVRGEPVVVPGA